MNKKHTTIALALAVTAIVVLLIGCMEIDRCLRDGACSTWMVHTFTEGK